MPSTKLTGSSTQSNPKQKTAMERAEEFPVRLQGAFALYKAMQMIEDDKENMTEEEYAAQMEVIAQIAINLAPYTPEA